MILFLQILSVVASVVTGIWVLGVFLISRLSPRVKSITVLNLLVGAPILSLGIWLPFVYGWIPA